MYNLPTHYITLHRSSTLYFLHIFMPEFPLMPITGAYCILILIITIIAIIIIWKWLFARKMNYKLITLSGVPRGDFFEKENSNAL